MPFFKLDLQKQQTVEGFVVVKADTLAAAEAKLDALLDNEDEPLESDDSRIKWEEPQDQSNTFESDRFGEELGDKNDLVPDEDVIE